MDDTATPGGASTGATPAYQRGMSVGRFLLVKQIGAGGMGVVWTAYDPDLDRQVALKFVRSDTLGSSGEEVLARLKREAKALAQLSHPNVITVHDVGTGGSEVYIAEEYVRGADLGTWLAEQPRTLDEILGVFAQAARGLAAAHHAGLVHRDFKPANALLGDDGRVRVVDFGLARKAVDDVQPSPGPDSDTIRRTPGAQDHLTQTGAIMGTPLYMAPEQHLGQPTDARTDQFSFCVALYEALYRERPFPGATLGELAMEAIGGKVRPAPARSTVPSAIRTALLKGLSAKPADRFPSMEVLLEALDASRPRSRGLRWPAALAGVLLVAGVVGFEWVSRRHQLCAGAGDQLARVWSPEKAAAVKAKILAAAQPYAPAAAELVQSSLDAYGREWAAMYTEACQATRVRGEQSEEVLDLRMLCLNERLAEMQAVSGVFERGENEAVSRAPQIVSGLAPVSMCGDVKALSAPIRLPHDPVVRAKVEAVRAKLASAKAEQDSARYDSAQKVAVEAVAEARDAGYQPLLAEALTRLGHLQVYTHQPKGAEETLEEAYCAAEASRHEQIAAGAAALMILTFEASRAAERHRWGRIAAAALARRPDPRIEVRLRLSESKQLSEESKFEEALAEARRALTVAENAFPGIDPSLATAHSIIGEVLRDLGRYPEAVSEVRRALSIREQAFGPHHPGVAFALTELGTTLALNGQYEEALGACQRALDIDEHALGVDDLQVAEDHRELGVVLSHLGRSTEALAQHSQALTIVEAKSGARSLGAADVHNDLGDDLSSLGRDQEAREQYLLALHLLEELKGKQSPEVATVEYNIGVQLNKGGHFREGLPHLERSLALRTMLLGTEHPETATSVAAIGQSWLGLRDFSRAAEQLKRGLAVIEIKAPMPEVLGEFRFSLAKATWGLGNKPAALELAARAKGDYSRALPGSRQTAAIDAWLKAPH